MDAGADYIMTQPAFNLEALKNVQEYRAKLPMVVGVMVLRDLQHARRYRAGGRIHSSAPIRIRS
ncbi:MAG: hypothetical protein HOL51_03950 [Gemmatimonadetes bacterium]|nr:hypothetical protein [Gemmatimonadota bacterium]MBT5447801.1 hypothetical protein [Gemmatimonadota bacterium]MBT5801967.1 hypothetical protein [Gemmatimonadota bacterium]MBT6903264.1 hypothetical protein [Gemmatimonadota bacterium]MBT7550480.1 hypothetical protein [Gemmatimonadota bacterium]